MCIYLKIYMHSNAISRHPVIGIRWFRIHWIRHVETNPMICVSTQTDKYSARYSRYCQITDLSNLTWIDPNIRPDPFGALIFFKGRGDQHCDHMAKKKTIIFLLRYKENSLNIP